VPPVVPRAAAATRRAALGGALATLAAVSACDLGQPVDRPADTTGAAAGTSSGEPSGTSSAPASSAGDDPDAALVDEVLGELAQLSSLVAGAARIAPLRASMRALGELHAAHREALGDERGTEPPARRGFPGPAEALRQVRAQEQRAQRRLADSSVAAESGALARLLASMSAAVAQQVATLPASARAAR
jgi:hypothetical protein